MENIEEIFCGIFPSHVYNYAHYITLDAIFLRVFKEVFKEALSMLSTLRFVIAEHVHVFRCVPRLHIEKLLKIEATSHYLHSTYIRTYARTKIDTQKKVYSFRGSNGEIHKDGTL